MLVKHRVEIIVVTVSRSVQLRGQPGVGVVLPSGAVKILFVTQLHVFYVL